MQILVSDKLAAVKRIVAKVLDGMALREAVKDSGITMWEFNKLLQSDKEAAVFYCRATELRADLLADEALHIADTSNDAAKARNQIDVRKWLAGKLNSRKYGDRIDLNVTQTIDIGATLAEARARVALAPAASTFINDTSNKDAVADVYIRQLRPVEVPGPNDVPDIFT